jgi:nucleotide-binding universal stress UspA family protein
MNITAMHPEQTGQDVKSRIPAQELKLRNILVPIDCSACSEKALRYAVPFARQFGAAITLLYVSEAQFQATEFAYLPIEELGITEAARERLDSVAHRMVPAALLGATLVRCGLACEQIDAVAREIDADLIIVSTHGCTGLKHFLAGSTAERVVRHAPCPVLVVRECEHEFV